MEVSHKMALQAMFRLSADTELAILDGKGPLLALMVSLRQDATQALAGLASIDPAKIEDVRKLQNEVQMFVDLVGKVKVILDEGDEIAKQLNAEEADELREAMGLEPQGEG